MRFQASPSPGYLLFSASSRSSRTRRICWCRCCLEAVRVGVQGRGFAMAAGEVRKLAERTAQAMAEITANSGHVAAGAERRGSGRGPGSELGKRDRGHRWANAAGSGGFRANYLHHLGQSTAVGNVVDTTERIEGMTRSASEVLQSASSTLDELSQQATKLRGVVERFHV